MRSNIEAERVRNNLTRSEISKKLGISSKTYWNYINNHTPIPSDVLVSMANLFHRTTDYLLELTTDSTFSA